MPPHDDSTSERLLAALAAAGQVAYTWDLTTDRVTWLGEGAVLGIADDAMIGSGRSFAGRINPADLPARQQALNDILGNRSGFAIEYRLRRDDGRFEWIEDRGSVMSGTAAGGMRVCGTLGVVTERKNRELALERQAELDELTGTLTKPRLRETVRHLLDGMCGRTNRGGAYFVLGIDNMTIINDAFGYEAADTVIAEVARRLERGLSPCDVLGRVGGDRFGLFLGNCGEELINATAEHLLAASSDLPVMSPAGPIYITVSLGCVVISGPNPPRKTGDTVHADISSDEIMHRGETALARAKRAGRDCFAIYGLTDGQRDRNRATMETGERVRRAMAEDRLLFAYQPVVASADAQPDYYECLIRMRKTDGTIVGAGAFIPEIERLGLIRSIDRLVLEKAVEELHAASGFNLGFNISGLTATHQPWLSAVTAILAGKPEIASRLVVEITETAALLDIEETARFVRTLKDLGCRVALDDFGAGFTSLRHLQMLAVDIVKIDGSFVRNLVQRPDSQIFLKHLLGLAHGLGLRTVAEWVESAEDAAYLRDQGVDLLQGYYFGKPSIEAPWEGHARRPSLSARRSNAAR